FNSARNCRRSRIPTLHSPLRPPHPRQGHQERRLRNHCPISRIQRPRPAARHRTAGQTLQQRLQTPQSLRRSLRPKSPQRSPTPWLDHLGSAIDEVTLGITNGNYKKPNEAFLALQKRLVAVSQSIAKPATSPAK